MLCPRVNKSCQVFLAPAPRPDLPRKTATPLTLVFVKVPRELRFNRDQLSFGCIKSYHPTPDPNLRQAPGGRQAVPLVDVCARPELAGVKGSDAYCCSCPHRCRGNTCFMLKRHMVRFSGAGRGSLGRGGNSSLHLVNSGGISPEEAGSELQMQGCPPRCLFSGARKGPAGRPLPFEFNSSKIKTFLRKLATELPYDPAIPLLGTNAKGLKAGTQDGCLCIEVHSCVIHQGPKVETTQVSISR